MSTAALPVTLDDIQAARERIAGLVTRTPVVPSHDLTARTGAAVFLKLDSLQPTGAFKLRGATNRLASLDVQERARGVVTMSTGNHGRGVALAARRLGIRAIVCLSRLVPANKVRAIEALGAEVRVIGASQDEAEVEAQRLVDEEGMILVPPFDDRHIIAGQGTIGLELVEDLPDIDLVLVPLSGGGLIGGIAVALKALSPRTRIIGVSMQHGAAMVESLRAGRPVPVQEVATLADSLGGGIGLQNRYTFDLVRTLVEDVVQVSEDEIAAAMAQAFWQDRQIGEGAAVVGQAALLAGKVRPARDAVTVCLHSGNNVDMARFTEIIMQHRPAAA